jgi:hypothetical protein
MKKKAIFVILYLFTQILDNYAKTELFLTLQATEEQRYRHLLCLPTRCVLHAIFTEMCPQELDCGRKVGCVKTI